MISTGERPAVSSTTNILRFAGFDLDLAGPELRLHGRVVPLRPKSLALIRHLAERPGQLVRKEDLVDAVWGTTAVTDATLARTLFDAREALGDDSRQPRFIETVHRLGFRFLAQLEAVRGESVSMPVAAAPTLVGRQHERTRLAELRRMAESGSRQIVFLAGEPGIGKTCILDAFLHESAGAANTGNGTESTDESTRASDSSSGVAKAGKPATPVAVPAAGGSGPPPTTGATARHPDRTDAGPAALIARGQCIEHYGTAEAYLPLLDGLGELCRRDHAGIVVPVLRRVAPTWLAQLPWLIEDADRAALERELRGVTSDRMLRELAQALETIAQQQLVVLALEDLHWSDSATVDLLAFVARRPSPARLIVVATYRPVDAILAENPIRTVHHELARQNRAHTIAVEALAASHVADLVTRRFDAAPFAAELAVVVHRRTEGNPLFVVSMLDDLVSQGSISLSDDGWKLAGPMADIEGSVPDDLLQMVRAQVEHLEDEERAVVEAASVIGVSFSSAAAAAALNKDLVDVEDLCEAMARRGVFLDRAGAASWPDGTSASAYSFRHALYCDALYTGIPAARRRRFHERVGQRLENAHAGDSTLVAGALARHFEEAGDHSRSAHYLRQAAEVAARRGAPREALAQIARAREHLERLPAGAARTFEELMLEIAAGPALAAVKGYASLEVEQIFARAREHCRALGDGPQLFPVLWGLWAFWCVRGRINDALELANPLFALAQESGDRDLMLEAHHAMWVTRYFRGDIGEADRHLDAGLALYDRSQHHAHVMMYGQDPGVVGLAYRCLVRQAQGRGREAVVAGKAAMELGRSLGHPVSLIFGVGFLGWMHQESGDAARCLPLAEEVLEIATTNGLAFWHAHGGWIVSRATFARDPAAGIAGMRAGIEALRAIGARMGLPGYLATLARALVDTGDLAEGRLVLEEGWAIGEETGEWLGRPEMLRLRGDLERNEPAGQAASSAESYYRQAIELARTQEAAGMELRAALSLAKLWRGQSRHDDVRELLAPLVEPVPDDDDSPEMIEARSFLGKP